MIYVNAREKGLTGQLLDKRRCAIASDEVEAD